MEECNLLPHIWLHYCQLLICIGMRLALCSSLFIEYKLEGGEGAQTLMLLSIISFLTHLTICTHITGVIWVMKSEARVLFLHNPLFFKLTCRATICWIRPAWRTCWKINSTLVTLRLDAKSSTIGSIVVCSTPDPETETNSAIAMNSIKSFRSCERLGWDEGYFGIDVIHRVIKVNIFISYVDVKLDTSLTE